MDLTLNEHSRAVSLFDESIWKDLDQKNMLPHAFGTIYDTLKLLRKLSLIIHIGVLVWLLFSVPIFMMPNILSLTMHIGVWGLLLNTTYYIGVFLFENAGPYRLSWKLIYILGEVSAAFGFCIVPFFLSYMIYEFIEVHDVEKTIGTLILYIFIHVVCPLLIWSDMVFNYYMFPKQHFKFVLFAALCYACTDFVVTMKTSKPIYPIQDWKSAESFIFTGFGFAMIVFGYFFGKLQYKWKMRQETKTIITTLQMNEISGPEKLSQYNPIEFDT